MLAFLLLIYAIPVYLVFIRFKVLPFNLLAKIAVAIPPIVAFTFLWFAFGRYTPMAQNVYAQADVVQISPEVSGPVTKVFVVENLRVRRGDPLFEIDKSTFQYACTQAEAQIVAAEQNAAGQLATLASAQEGILQAEASLAASKENLTGTKANAESAGQNVTGAKASLEAARANTSNTKAQLALADTNRQRYAELVKAGAETRANLDDAVKNAEVARGNFDAARQDEIRAQAAVSSAEAQVLTAGAAVLAASAQVNANEAVVAQAKATRRKAEVQIDPEAAVQGVLANKDSIRPDQKYLIDRVTQSLERYKQATAFLNGRDAGVIQAEQALNLSRYNLAHTTIFSPCDGMISSMNLTVGSYVRTGTPIMAVTDFSQWRLKAPVPENWLELVRPNDRVLYSLRNYPGQVREAEVQSIGRGVVHGQSVPNGNMPDPDSRFVRQTDTPDDQSDFIVLIRVEDDRQNEPLRVGATGRITIFASGGIPVVNTLATIIHWIFSITDYFFPKPSALVLTGLACIAGGIYYVMRRKTPSI